MSKDNYYQVPNKSLGEFNITNDRIYTQTLCSDAESGVFDTNFGELAKLSSIPVATEDRIGGIKLYTDDDNIAAGQMAGNKQYAVQVDDDFSYAYVYVPWINTLYQADPDDKVSVIYETGELSAIDGTCLSVTKLSGTDEEDNVVTSGGVQGIGLNKVPAEKLVNIGDMVRITDRHSRFNNVSDDISIPLQKNIDDLKEYVNDYFNSHIIDNNNDFDFLSNEINSLSSTVDDEIYLKTETSSYSELFDAFLNLSNDFVKYLNNTLIQNEKTNPAYLKTETSSDSQLKEKFDSLSDTVKYNYYIKDLVYQKSETSSKIELDEMFDTKQDNLSVSNKIHSSLSTDKNIPTIKATIDYVNSSINKATATFQGQFDSWSKVPTDARLYLNPTPNKNDYIYVCLNANEAKYLNLTNGEGTWKFIMAYDNWNAAKGKNNWEPEYKISDTLFTDAQTAALNSGITLALKNQYSNNGDLLNKLKKDYDDLKSRLRALAFTEYIEDNITGEGSKNQIAVFTDTNKIQGMSFNPTKETWIFETYQGKQVKKNILVQNI